MTTQSNQTGSLKLETWGAKLWNVVNEGKSFSLLSAIFLVALLWSSYGYEHPGLGSLLLAPMLAVICFFDYPLQLRWMVWAWFVFWLVVTWHRLGFEAWLVPTILWGCLYFFFTLFVWGFVYYHFLTREPMSTSIRFVTLVMTNEDSTSGNFWLVFPLVSSSLLVFGNGSSSVGWGLGICYAMAMVGFAGASVVAHRWWHRRMGTHDHPKARPLVDASCSKMYVIVVDGGRADVIRNPSVPTPFLDDIAANGLEYTNVRTMYPARTSVCFTSMFTGRPPNAHGVRSNLVIRRPTVRTVFDCLEESGRKGAVVGVAHFHDIASRNWNLKTVSSFVSNEVADESILGAARQVLETEDPDLLVVQLIAVDQTGHMHGSQSLHYARAVTKMDRDIRSFKVWLEKEGRLDDAILIVMSDHGQGKGIGGHGFWGEGEIIIPMILWGHEVPRGKEVEEKRSIMDLAPTIVRSLLGAGMW